MNGDIAHSDPGPPSLPRKVTIQRENEGYGFNLHGEKGIHGQYISAIDDGSPAQENDLRVGDRVIAVNNEDVEDLPHSKVVERIRAGGNEVTLLVIDELCDQYYKNLGLKIPQDKFETPGQAAAVAAPPVEENHVVNEVEAKETPVETPAEEINERENVQNIEVSAPEPQVVEEPANEPSDNTTDEAEEEDEADEDAYEDVIPKTTPETKPPEIVPENPPEIPQETKPTEQDANTTTTQVNSISNGPSDTADDASKVDMAAARPKPKRHDVKRATQNWKQKYDDFNKL